jgi:hypothetical protein
MLSGRNGHAGREAQHHHGEPGLDLGGLTGPQELLKPLEDLQVLPRPPVEYVPSLRD